MMRSLLVVLVLGHIRAEEGAVTLDPPQATTLEAARHAHDRAVREAGSSFYASVGEANARLADAYHAAMEGCRTAGRVEQAHDLWLDLFERIRSTRASVPATRHGQLIGRLGPTLVMATGARVPSAGLTGPRYVLLYNSGTWCGSCHAFVPRLIAFYNQHRGGGALEIVHIPGDDTEAKMLQNMKAERMPWPAMDVNRRDATEITGTGGGVYLQPRGVPNLVLLDEDDHVVSDTYGPDGAARGPDRVLEDAARLVQ